MSSNPPISTRLAILLPLILFAMANTAPSSLPQVDFSKMGTVGLGGSFAGLDWWSSDSPFASGSSSTFSSTGDTLLSRASDGTIRPVGSTNVGGRISTLCWANSTDSNGTLYIGGSFSSVGSTSSANLVAYSVSSSNFAAIPGISGPVETLYCDNANQQVWVGGSFSAPASNVALWSTSISSWSTVGFGGLNGPVMEISPSANGSTIYFSGSFTTVYQTNSTSDTTVANITSIPSASGNTSTVGNSGYLTPVTIPSTSSASGSLTITAGPSSSQSQYSDPNVLLCPGKGVWLAEDNTVSNVDILGYNYLRATGVRMANGLVEGRGATAFCVTSLPDNTQLNMTYTDLVTGKNATCWDYCPLYTDLNISGQDFVFTEGVRNLTGLQMQLKRWIGDGAGLSSVQLLSDGAYGSAVQAANSGVCGSGTNNSAQTTGNWTVHTTTTDIPATTSYYLSTEIPTSNVTHPSVTFYPYVSAAGYYDIYMVIPGCAATQDCDSRTSVDVEVFPQEGGLGWTSSISEQVSEDTRTLVFSGLVEASSSSFTPTISLALAAAPAGVSSDHYSVVAQAVELVLTATTAQGNGTSTTATESNTTTTTTRAVTNSSLSVAYGVFEWPRSAQSVNAASGALGNVTETAVTKLGFALDAAYNTSGSPPTWSINAIAAVDTTVFVGGNFSASGNFSYVVSVDVGTGQTAALAGQGLNGVVRTAAIVGGNVYFGGDFTFSADGSTALKYLAKYDPKSKAWSALAGGVDGSVTSLAVSSNQVIVVGNFSNAILSNGSSTYTGPYAVWDTSASAWSTGGVVFGNLSTAAVDSSQAFFAGRVSGSSSNPANGIAFLSSSGSGAQISSLPGATFASTGSGVATSSSSKRAVHQRSSLTRNWLSRFTGVFDRSHGLVSRATAPAIPLQTAPAPAVLAGDFWTNSSASDHPSVTILGGNFTSSSASALAFYANDALSGPSTTVQGVIRALAVVGDIVYAGGTGVNVTGAGSGLVAYNLASGSWMTGGIPSLNPASGSTLSVNAIRMREATNTVVVAGNFATAGSLGCAGVCLWDVKGGQWSTPGSGLASGEVRAVDFAGNSYEFLLVAGSFVLPSGDITYVASYSFDNTSWTGIGTLPGPALALAVDNKNASNVFAAGYSSTDGTPYLQQWNGEAWSPQNGSLESGSLVSSLAFVPMTSEHVAAGAIESDRMLMVSGALHLENTGNVSAALYDGARWYPYLVGTSTSGTLGAASSLFWSQSSFSFTIQHFLATGLVVLVAIAIATGLILLLLLLFFVIAYLLRRKERWQPATIYKEDPGSEVSSTHQHVFNNVQAALEATLAGGAGAVVAQRRSEDSRYASEHEGADESDEEGRETTMRYDFDGPELQPGEMSMRAGQRIVVLDDSQSDEWWYARDPATGREGVVPATYVW